MLNHNNSTITASHLRTYLYSLEHEKEREKAKRAREYKAICNANDTKLKKREIAKIEKAVDKEYTFRLKIRDEIVDLLKELKEIPRDIEKLEIAEYMLYRVDMRKTEKIVNRVAKKLGRRYDDILKEIEDRIREFPVFDNVEYIDYSEYNTNGDAKEAAKEKYRLEYTEEERNALIAKDLEVVERMKYFNTIPIPHEILKHCDREIQAKMQKFNNIRQKRIRILSTMEQDYKKLIDPREIQSTIDDALANIDDVKGILTNAEYSSIKKALIKRRKRIHRSTNDIRMVIQSKEKKVGIANFNIQEARYQRMENLRNIILEATNLIRQNPIEEPEKQLEKLKISYQREKQFASVIEKLDDGRRGDNPMTELRAYEEQIYTLENKINRSKRIVEEQQEKIKNAKKELLVLWKMEISTAVSKKRETLELPGPHLGQAPKRVGARREIETSKKAFMKLKKASRGKHACT